MIRMIRRRYEQNFVETEKKSRESECIGLAKTRIAKVTKRTESFRKSYDKKRRGKEENRVVEF